MIATRRFPRSFPIAGLAAAVLLVEAGLAADVTVTPLGGEPVEGGLAELSTAGVTIDAAGRRRGFAAEALPIVRVRNAPSGARTPLAGCVWLVGGSSLPITGVRSLGGEGDLELQLAGGDSLADVSLAVSIDRVRAIQFPGQRRQDPAAWQSLRRRSPTDDLVVAAGKDGAPMDYVEGFVEAIGDEHLTVVLDTEPISAPLAKVFGVVFASEPLDAAPAFTPEVQLAGGARLRASEVSLAGGEITVATPSGVTVSAGVASLVSIDYTLGRLAYLGDLEPLRVGLTPLLGTPAAIAEGPGWPAFRSGAGYWGGRLTLAGGDGLLRRYEQGLALRSGGDLTYAVDGQKRLQGVIGVAPAAPRGRAVRLRIDAAGEVLLDRTFAAGEPPHAVDLDLDGAATIRLRVERQAGPDAVLNFGQARLVR